MVAHGLVDALAERDFQHTQDAVHRRADLVAHGGEEGRFGAVGGFSLAAGVFEVGVEFAQALGFQDRVGLEAAVDEGEH